MGGRLCGVVARRRVVVALAELRCCMELLEHVKVGRRELEGLEAGLHVMTLYFRA